jgi:DNA polymerase-3 subunit delta'
MGFELLLGNERIKDNLRLSFEKNRVPHFFLICGPQGSGRHTLARLLAAAMMCTGQNQPCGYCEGCRKVLNGIHPDFITVDDPEKKTVPVELIRQARADIYIQPNEGKRKIYLFPRAQDILPPGQNALLKILEEPPSYGVFLLITDNAEKLLPTVRSRCTELTLLPLSEKEMRGELHRRFPDASVDTIGAAMSRSGGYLGQAISLLEGREEPQQTVDFAAAFAARNALGLTMVLAPMEKWKRDQLLPVLEQWVNLLEESLACRAGGRALSELSRTISAGRSASEILAAIRQLQKCIEYAQGNVSPAAVCGYLQWALR